MRLSAVVLPDIYGDARRPAAGGGLPRFASGMVSTLHPRTKPIGRRHGYPSGSVVLAIWGFEVEPTIALELLPQQQGTIGSLPFPPPCRLRQTDSPMTLVFRHASISKKRPPNRQTSAECSASASGSGAASHAGLAAQSIGARKRRSPPQAHRQTYVTKPDMEVLG